MAILMTNKVNVQQNVPQIVFVTATIELAVQITNTVITISRHLPLHQPTIRLSVPGENGKFPTVMCYNIAETIDTNVSAEALTVAIGIHLNHWHS